MDDLLATTSASYCALMMPSFMDNILRQVEPIRTKGTFFSPNSGDRKLPTCATCDIAAAAGPKGRAASAETSASMHAEILTYSRTRGLFAGVSLKGAVLQPDKDANKSLYNRPVEAKELVETGVAVPAAAQKFVQAVSQAAR